MEDSFENMDPLQIGEDYRNKELAQKAVKRIRELAEEKHTYRFMHICGTHEYTITHSGLRDVLPSNVEVVAGPGCPVCVTPPEDIALAITIAKQPKVLITTFGDMMRVPATGWGSLNTARARGAKVQVVYSMMDAIEAARKNPDLEVVHFAIGFETTTPPTAVELLAGPPENFSVIVSHRVIPPAQELLLESGEVALNGFILPGHVCTVTGTRPYMPISEKWKVPQVVAGFEPLDVLLGLVMLLTQIAEGRAEVENEYTRAVSLEGNVRAQEMVAQVFETIDARWRAIGSIPKSGLALRPEFASFDVREHVSVDVEPPKFEVPPGCRCGEVLRGVIGPEECPLFGKKCTPQQPIGPCMVGLEGTCAIVYGALAIKPKT
ncbi:MAG: hydrogenase formation protein HypD [Promethearchaeota archaeon]